MTATIAAAANINPSRYDVTSVGAHTIIEFHYAADASAMQRARRGDHTLVRFTTRDDRDAFAWTTPSGASTIGIYPTTGR